MQWHWSDQGTPGTVLPSLGGVISVRDNPNAGQRPYVFLVGQDGHLWVDWWDWSGGAVWRWSDQGAPAGKGISSWVSALTVRDSPAAADRPYVLTGGSDGHLWVNWWDGGAWHWSDLGTPEDGISDIVSAVTVQDSPAAPERPFAFCVRAADGHLCLDAWDGQAWHWSDQGTPGDRITSWPTAITVMDGPGAPRRPYAFVVGNDGHLWVNWWDGSAWHWSDQVTPGGRISNWVSAITVRDSPFAAQRPHVFCIREDDGHVWVNWWDGGAWHWSDQGMPGSPMSSWTAAITVQDNPQAAERPYVFTAGSDGHLWVNWWDGRAWFWSDQGTTGTTTVQTVVGALTVMDSPGANQRHYAFARGADAHLWANWWG